MGLTSAGLTQNVGVLRKSCGFLAMEINMKKIAWMLTCLALAPAVYAGEEPLQVALDTVMFQVAAKQWVSTQTALLNVNINVTLSNADLVKARNEIMSKLGAIASGEWHLVQFDRSQDSSGLEKLYVQAQARVSQSSLTNIYQNAKAVTKPGASYEIGSVDFKPSLGEIQQVRAQLREQLYKQVNDEIARLNKAYAGQNYSLNYLVFSDGDMVPMPQPRSMQSPAALNAMVMSAPAPSLTVSNELTMTAMVQAASNRKKVN